MSRHPHSTPSSPVILSSDDQSRPATPKQRAPRILVPDSSPLTFPDHVSPARRPAAARPTSSSHARPTMSGARFQSAMQGNRSSLAKSQFAPPASNGSSLSSPAKDASVFRSSIEHFKYGTDTKASSKEGSRAAIDVDARGSDDDAKPKPKKRRLVRGGGAGGQSDEGDSATTSNRTSPTPSTSRTTTPIPLSSSGTGNGSAARESASSDVLLRKAIRLHNVYSGYETADLFDALKLTKGDGGKALEVLKRRKAAAAESAAAGQPRKTPQAVPTSRTTSHVSKTLPAQRKAQQQQQQQQAAIVVDDDGDDGERIDNRRVTELSSDEDDAEEIDRADKEDRAAVNWFNTADENALMDTTNCSAAQAQTIIGLRPFRNADDVEAKLGDKAAKGVTPRIFNACKELMAGYYEVDEVLAKCEKVGRELSSAMASWYPDSAGPSSRVGSPAAGTSREGTPSGTLNLSTVKKGASIRDKYYLEEQPRLLADGVTLKDYQLVGVNWLNLLYRKKTSAILADEMGLGKTAQVISFFAHLKETGVRGPHLVVAPSSVLENWDREFRFFAPSINVRRYYGSQKDRVELREELRYDEDVEVILTTYEMASGGPADHAFLRKRGFNVCVYDEGHVLKNRKSQKYDKLLRIRSQWRLLLTGTPLQNNLQELISLLNFIMPQYFSSAEEALAAIFKVKAGAQQNQLSKQRVGRAKRMMQPFVLRRLKDKVLTDLGTKTITVEYCEMTPVQKKVYAQAVARSRAAALGEADQADRPRAGSRTRGGTTGGSKDSGHVLMELRKAANHPLLTRRIFDEKKIDAMARDLMKEPDYADANFEHTKEDLRINTDAQLSFSANTYPSTRKHVLPAREWMNAGKVKALERLIPEIKARGERILIFSQFTMVLDILCVCLEHMGIRYVGFTGATQVEDRQHLVDQFTNDPEITVFLLSTKAGGLGINLVAANWVILFDQDFNPQNDKQAADRCYRMGQKKPVTVIKLICKGTIDEDIHALGERKIQLAERVSGEEDLESDEAEQQKVAQTLLSQLRERPAEVVEIDDD
ncbi:uncharacterized protein PFL1_03181 [Pseudozyma flocculosa PF-1]|uniref:DNA helicase n=2 Tax=Pseudozyma flocculosa TaxID=84751 RepID=A0A5C3F1L6_9BASI|nr:uncharacterized protein PFL1_03181 [Pseudozyma flocculosa PF-1]EPQ29426.1 hypothetical protein PFL1_03181 [Pseudozyma flocculosa PF-1]SPO37950.1 related to FUN30 - protein important for chromosome integrity and segregation [Pseudozyma flocculosa]